LGGPVHPYGLLTPLGEGHVAGKEEEPEEQDEEVEGDADGNGKVMILKSANENQWHEFAPLSKIGDI
jgi:hypothetical protein